jgi:LysM repeat protein
MFKKYLPLLLSVGLGLWLSACAEVFNEAAVVTVYQNQGAVGAAQAQAVGVAEGGEVVTAGGGEATQPGQVIQGGQYQVVLGDTLSGISRQYYGNWREYVRIYQANTNQIQDPDLIFPGQLFVIPGITVQPGSTPVPNQPGPQPNQPGPIVQPLFQYGALYFVRYQNRSYFFDDTRQIWYLLDGRGRIDDSGTWFFVTAPAQEVRVGWLFIYNQAGQLYLIDRSGAMRLVVQDGPTWQYGGFQYQASAAGRFIVGPFNDPNNAARRYRIQPQYRLDNSGNWLRIDENNREFGVSDLLVVDENAQRYLFSRDGRLRPQQ